MKRVTELYDSFSWGKNGVFTKKTTEDAADLEFNITKNDVFYLKKKKKGKKPQEDR